LKIVFSPDPVVRSLQRLVEFSKLLKEYKDPIIYSALKKESTILLRRTFKLWVDIRVGENWLPWRILNKIKTGCKAIAERLQELSGRGFFYDEDEENDEEDEDEEFE
jgi:hypothetical protein